MLAVFVNSIAVILGSFIGLLFAKKFTDELSDMIKTACGVITVVLGIQMAFKYNSIVYLALSLIIGAIIGYVIDIDGAILKLGYKLEKLTQKKSKKAVSEEKSSEPQENSLPETNVNKNNFAYAFLNSSDEYDDCVSDEDWNEISALVGDEADDLPIDILKLDMGFLRDSTNMDKGGRIISSLVTMAQNLEYTTVAEGVETQEQADFLKGIGVDIIQGFLYSKPVSEKKYLDIVSNQTNTSGSQDNKSFADLSDSDKTNSDIIEINKFYNPNSSESLMFDKLFGPAAIFDFNPRNNKSQILRVNQKALRIFGLENYSFKQLQRSLKDFFKKESRILFYETIKKAINTESEAICIIKDVENINNEEIWVKVHISIVNKKEDSYIIYVLFDDITDEMEVENNLSISNNYLSTLMDNTQVGMCLMNLQINILSFPENLKIKILKINKHFSERVLYKEKEILEWNEKKLLDMVHPMDRPGFLAKSLQSFSTGYAKPYTYALRVKNKRGQYIHTKVSVNGVKQADGSYMLFTTYINLDEEI